MVTECALATRFFQPWPLALWSQKSPQLQKLSRSCRPWQEWPSSSERRPETMMHILISMLGDSGDGQGIHFKCKGNNPNRPSYHHLEPTACYQCAKKEKDHKHCERVGHIEHATFIPLILLQLVLARWLQLFWNGSAPILQTRKTCHGMVVWSAKLLSAEISNLMYAGLCLSVRKQVTLEDLKPRLATCQANIRS